MSSEASSQEEGSYDDNPSIKDLKHAEKSYCL